MVPSDYIRHHSVIIFYALTNEITAQRGFNPVGDQRQGQAHLRRARGGTRTPVKVLADLGPPTAESGRRRRAHHLLRRPLILSRVHWVEPKLVAEITYMAWTADTSCTTRSTSRCEKTRRQSRCGEKRRGERRLRMFRVYRCLFVVALLSLAGARYPASSQEYPSDIAKRDPAAMTAWRAVVPKEFHRLSWIVNFDGVAGPIDRLARLAPKIWARDQPARLTYRPVFL
jgi:hypothetical protein